MNRFRDWVKTHVWMILGAKVLFTLLVLFAWWLSGVLERAVSTVGSIPSSFWWWVVGILAAIAVIVLIWRNRTTVGSSVKKIRLGWVFGLSALVGVIFLSYYFEEAVETRVTDYLRDKDIGGLPILARSEPVSPEATLAIICEAESGGRHFDEDGNVITNKNTDGTIDIGYCQINSQHEERSKAMGFDIWTEEDNVAFAQVLLDEFGTTPWNASKDRWGNKIVAPYAKSFSGVTVATKTIRVGREWSDWIRVPPGRELFFQRMDENVAFEVELQGGETFEFQRNFPGHKRFSLIQEIRFRVTDKEAKELAIWLRYSPYEIT